MTNNVIHLTKCRHMTCEGKDMASVTMSLINPEYHQMVELASELVDSDILLRMDYDEQQTVLDAAAATLVSKSPKWVEKMAEDLEKIKKKYAKKNQSFVKATPLVQRLLSIVK